MPLWSLLPSEVTNLSSLLIMSHHFPSHFGSLLITASRSYAPLEVPFPKGDQPVLTSHRVTPLSFTLWVTSYLCLKILCPSFPKGDQPVLACRPVTPLPFTLWVTSLSLPQDLIPLWSLLPPKVTNLSSFLFMSHHFPWFTSYHCLKILYPSGASFPQR